MGIRHATFFILKPTLGRSAALIAPQILRFDQNVAPQSLVDLGAAGAPRQSQRRNIQGVKIKEIAMRPVTFRRARSAVSEAAEIVSPALTQLSGLIALRQRAHRGLKIGK